MTLAAEQHVGAPDGPAAGLVEPVPAVAPDAHHDHLCVHGAKHYRRAGTPPSGPVALTRGDAG